jgi:hypothetical protein
MPQYRRYSHPELREEKMKSGGLLITTTGVAKCQEKGCNVPLQSEYKEDVDLFLLISLLFRLFLF